MHTHPVPRHLAVLMVLALLAFGPPPAVAQEEGDPDVPEEKPTAEALAEDAIHHLAAWRHTKARELLEPVEKSVQSEAPLATAWALTLAEEGEPGQAVEMLAEAAEDVPSDPAPLYWKGEVHYWTGDYGPAGEAWGRALERARNAVEADADNPRANYYLGATLIRNRAFADAREPLETALEGGWDEAATRYQLGLSYYFDKKWSKGKEAFDAAIQADPTFAHAYYYRGRAWKEMGRTDEMMLDMERFLELAGDSREAAIARSLLRAGQG